MKSILLIYTGGTIGMKTNPATGALAPFDFDQIESEVPELRKFQIRLRAVSFDPLLDSSNVGPEDWQKLARTIQDNYMDYDGFVILHGTDTMSYSASALSFMLENLAKPVIFTGSQIPMGVLRTDGRENLVSAIEIAASGQVPEVCIYFQNLLMRGNRTTKKNAEHFNAFVSHNFPPLAEAGINIRYNEPYINRECVFSVLCPLSVSYTLNEHINVVRIFPGITPSVLSSQLEIPGLRAVIMETYGSGNAPCHPWLLEILSRNISRGLIILNVTQCSVGSVDMTLYDTGRALQEIGVLSGSDSTTEAAVTKMMYLLGKYDEIENVKKGLKTSLRGEISL